jgi:hypothetical protein
VSTLTTVTVTRAAAALWSSTRPATPARCILPARNGGREQQDDERRERER